MQSASATTPHIHTPGPSPRRRKLLAIAAAGCVLLAVAALAGCGGSAGTTASPGPSTPGPSVTGTGSSHGFLLFMTGSVDVGTGDQWQSADIGTEVQPPQRVRTGASSVAEIQLGGNAAVMLLENTVVALEAGPRGTAAVHLESGSLIARAEKFPDGTRLRVRSANNIISAQDANFTVEQNRDTRVAVSSGSATVLATGIDPADIPVAAAEKEIRSGLDALAASAVVIGEGREVTVPYGAGDASRQILQDVQSRIASPESAGGNAAPAGAVAKKDRDLISTLLVYVGQRAAAEVPSGQPISQEVKQKLDDAPVIRIVPTTPDAGGTAFSTNGLARITIKTDPTDAEILLDDQNIGKTIYSGLFQQNETVTFTVRSRGYQDKKVEVTFTHDLNREITVSLDRAKPSVSPGQLFSAIAAGQADVLTRYLASGGDPNVRTQTGLTPLAVALGADRMSTRTMALPTAPNLVALLLNGGADPNVAIPAGGQQFTPLFLVVASGLATGNLDMKLVDSLIAAGADPNVYVQSGNLEVNVLGMAIIVGVENHGPNLELIRDLIRSGAKIDSVLVYEGRIMSPLVASVVLGAENSFVDADLVGALLESGAPVNGMVNVSGEIGTPLHFAEKYGFTDIVALLKRHGAHE